MTSSESICETSAFAFDTRPEFVADYDRNVRFFIPAYEASHDLAIVLLRETGLSCGHLLAIGAGGGGELAHFAPALPEWRFTAVDPSSAMLDQARSRLAGLGLTARVDFVNGIAPEAPPGPFDAATAFLALHFVPDDGARLDQLRAIRERLRPGAPFLMMNGVFDRGGPNFERDLRRYADHAALRGADPEIVAEAVRMQRSAVHFLPPAREEQLLAEAGFKDMEQFFHSLWIRAWRATA